MFTKSTSPTLVIVITLLLDLLLLTATADDVKRGESAHSC
jgi:hypothetical protein